MISCWLHFYNNVSEARKKKKQEVWKILMRVSELGGQDGMCLLDVLCCRMKFSQAHMCVNDSFAGRLKSDIKTERNA